MQRSWKLIDALSTALGWLALAAIMLMVAHVSIDVVAKYFFGSPIPATLTVVANYYMPMIVFMPLAFLERKNGHIRVEFVTDMFSKSAQRHAAGWTLLLSAAICALLAYATWIEALSKYRISAFQIEHGIRLATWPLRFAAPIGYGLMCVVLILKFAGYITGRGMRRSEHLDSPGGAEAA